VAFKRFLGRGKPGDISMLWPTLEETVVTIRGAGGLAVLAHPLDYKMTATRLRALTRAFQTQVVKPLRSLMAAPEPAIPTRYGAW